MHEIVRTTTALLCVGALSACATLESGIDTPQVSLRDVAVDSLDMKRQTFVLNFDVTNPNPFPLPISRVRYGVELDGHRFASGEAECALVVPAQSDGQFEVTVDLDLLTTAPKLLFIVRDAARRDIPYALTGRLGLNIPMSPAVPFAHEGSIRLQALAY